MNNNYVFFKRIMKLKLIHLLLVALLIFCNLQTLGKGNYKNFKVSVYTRAYEVQKMSDSHWLDSTWQVISSQLKVDKIYLETHRDLIIVSKEVLENAKKFFENKGLEVAGGITYTIDESNYLQTFCYSREQYRKKAQEIIEHSASIFDEVILDDFFFTNCKCDTCVVGKGDQSWSEYRLNLMTEASKNIILGPAKKVNPNVQVIIKYPNWYDHFQELGFNLETEPKLFDGLYTGTETRDGVFSEQHLQPYLGYSIFRYFNNLKPGKNGGGWVDTGGMRFYDRYAEQLWLTILAKAPEMTLFDYRQLLYPLKDNWTPKWKDENTSFDYSSFFPNAASATVAKIGSHSLKIIDKIAGELGQPYGIKCYKPAHSIGEDFLENYLGMIGIPIDMVPEFPTESKVVLLTEHAKKDSEIVQKIKQQLIAGKDVIITSGLVNALQDRGLRNLVNLEYTSRKSNVNEFLINRKIVPSNKSIIIPQIQYSTNDSWELISGMDSGLGWPLLHAGIFSNGKLYMLTVPENFSDLYNLPVKVLNKIREVVCNRLGIELNGGAKISLFLYDNSTFVVESFNDETVEVEILLQEKANSIIDLSTNEKLKMEVIPESGNPRGKPTPEKYGYKVTLPTHSFRAFKIN
ncbi:MAG: hypothetical protein K9G44_13035 [Melioribacteraceae bacterium]|nr:hypothetical protein [Melioribacteraceae bacterium]